MGLFKISILYFINLFIHLLYDFHGTGHNIIGNSIKQMIGAALGVAFVTLAGFPDLIERLDRIVMVGDNKIFPQENIQLVRMQVAVRIIQCA